ncbi:hypothetical protein GCM10009641_40020 [Mycobacterium cookii]|uniref:Uncharacterized protein n=1 Tax=Mycobacterium cookii TaxID=1775 RepID=A0A7I7KXN7_9MYCO|nr:hypothetical protein [Mycobacterium cookii]MCV7331554.1 hypothetical protein [Mycobacterium cookii]BBX46845.1 hypothetical protein MCOO_28600 [Mycobacterium cookii]
MTSSRRLTAGLALGSLLVSPLIALLASPVANADDLSTIGPYTLDGYTDTFTYDTTTSGFDNFLTGSFDSYPFNVDIYSGAPGSGDSEVLLTIPLLAQIGYQDVGGTITPIDTFNAADFVSPDIGLGHLGGTPAPGDIVSLGPFTIGGYADTFSINSGTFAIDNFVTGTSNSLPFALDLFAGAPGSGSSELLLTVPLLFQVGLDDVGGTLTPIFSLNPADFITPDIGLAGL